MSGQSAEYVLGPRRPLTQEQAEQQADALMERAAAQHAEYGCCDCGHWPYSHVEEKGCLRCGCVRLTDGVEA